jgi:hypothetical protein
MSESVTERREWRFNHFMAVVGMALFLVGPIACFGAYVLGRDGNAALGFGLLFAGMGFLVVWVAAITDPGDEA